jgi:hypothetical protein
MTTTTTDDDNRTATTTIEMPSETQIQAAQQRCQEAIRLLAESLGVPVQEQQLAPPPSPNPDDFGASFGEDDGGEAAPRAQATANSCTGGIAGSLGAAAMQPPPRRIITNHNAQVLGGGRANPRNDEPPLMDEHTCNVLRHRLSKGARNNYDGANVRFIKWLFDNSSEYGAPINPLIMERLVEAHRQDSTRLTKAGFPCKQRKEMSKVLREVLNNIRPEDPSTSQSNWS